jgi:7-carboxy-7-deazaguanine synthase
MKVNEIFKSIQGEGSWQGLPCIFIRLTGCNLRCRWCDTKYAYTEGKEMSIKEIVDGVNKIAQNKCQLVEITGGEPLLQEEVYELTDKLLSLKYKILIETNGSISIDKLSSEVIRIIDIKCPSSEMSDKMYWDNLKNLRSTDEIKFVLSNYKDYEWAKKVIKTYKLTNILFSPVIMGKKYVLSPRLIAKWILKDNLQVKLQIQLHKYLNTK